MTGLTTEEFISRSIKIHGDRYDYSKVKYVHNKLKIKIICKKHGEFEQTPANHVYRKRGCHKCSIDSNFKFTTGQFVEKAVKIHGNKYDYSLVKYDNYYSKVVIKCQVHGEFMQTPNQHLAKNGCPKCANVSRGLKTSNRVTLAFSDFVEKAIKMHGNKYDYSLSKYLNRKHKIKIICKSHGTFLQTPKKHITGQGCPICLESHGERKIAKYLDAIDVDYSREFNVKNMMRFDFYIASKDLAVEYDGEQHFRPVECFGGQVGFEKTKKRDAIKNKYCKDNGIRLIRISYKKLKKIDEILDSIFVT